MSENTEIRPPILIVDARVRYWEDAAVNGKDDNDGTLIPFRDGDLWKPSIDLQNGKIIGWPEGVTADIHYKVCDGGEYWLADADGTKRMKWRGHYVPDAFLCMGDRGFGDYIILTVLEDGKIAEWSFPVIDFDEWEALSSESSPAIKETSKNYARLKAFDNLPGLAHLERIPETELIIRATILDWADELLEKLKKATGQDDNTIRYEVVIHAIAGNENITQKTSWPKPIDRLNERCKHLD